MDEIDLGNSLFNAALGGGAGGSVAFAVLYTKLNALVERVKAVEDDAKEARSAAGTKHEANAARIAAVERDSAVHAVSMANLSNQIAAIGSAIQRLEDRVAQVPNDLREILASSKR